MKRIWKVALGLFLLPFGFVIALCYIIVCLFTFSIPDSEEHKDLNYIGVKSFENIKEGVLG